MQPGDWLTTRRGDDAPVRPADLASSVRSFSLSAPTMASSKATLRWESYRHATTQAVGQSILSKYPGSDCTTIALHAMVLSNKLLCMGPHCMQQQCSKLSPHDVSACTA